MRNNARRSDFFLAINWLLFFAVSLWISLVQSSLLWWLRLGWGNWLTEFSVLAKLEPIPAGSLWILWLMVSLITTLICLFLPAKRAEEPAEDSQPIQGVHALSNAELIDARPDLKEKLLRLHQSLDRI